MNPETKESQTAGEEKIKNPFRGGEEGIQKSFFEMSFSDHESLKSGLGDDALAKRMEREPEKTAGQLMTDEEILDRLLEYFSGEIGMIRDERASSGGAGAEKKRENSFRIREEFEEEFLRSLKYLKEIGRLPEEFKHYLKNES